MITIGRFISLAVLLIVSVSCANVGKDSQHSQKPEWKAIPESAATDQRSNATKKPKHVAEWEGSQVYMLAQEGGFQWETLELKDGRFRYWFASDVILANPPKYPIEGSYEFKDDRLILSNGNSYEIRRLQGTRTLWRSSAVSYWDHHIIDVYGILLPVESIKSGLPMLQPMFSKEQWDRSREQVRQFEQKK